MKISEIIKNNKRTLSFEVFPPKTEDKYDTVETAVTEIAKLSPDFMSVTYGAGGGTSKFTAIIANLIKQNGVTPLAHLSCVSSTKQMVKDQLEVLKATGIENILALRGDIPEDEALRKNDYKYASELVCEIKKYGDLCIGGACYPEGHPESPTLGIDIENLKNKVDCGCDFLTTQMFFENEKYYDFVNRARSIGINIPIVAGIMPVTNAKNITRMLSLSKTELSDELKKYIEKYIDSPDDMKKAGVEYAIKQCEDLYANGVQAIHIYSMNKPDIALAIKTALGK